MSLLPAEASFHEQVADFFVRLRGSGVALSATDHELLDRWAERGVPVEVVIRGLHKAAVDLAWDASVDSTIRHLRSARRHVEREIRVYLKLTAGRTLVADADATPFYVARFGQLASHLKALAGQTPNAMRYVGPWIARAAVPNDYDDCVRKEELALFLLARSQILEDRVKLLRRAQELVAQQSIATAHSKRLALRAVRIDLIREAWSIPRFS